MNDSVHLLVEIILRTIDFSRIDFKHAITGYTSRSKAHWDAMLKGSCLSLFRASLHAHEETAAPIDHVVFSLADTAGSVVDDRLM